MILSDEYFENGRDKVDYSKIITYYRRKLVDYGVIRELKNSYKSKGKYTGIINKEDRVVA